MKKRQRLVRRGDFRRTLAQSRVYSSPALVALARSSPAGGLRVGVGASRRFPGAVARNRARRRLREAARLELFGNGWEGAGAGISFDVVLIARPPLLELEFAALRKQVAALRARLAPS